MLIQIIGIAYKPSLFFRLFNNLLALLLVLLFTSCGEDNDYVSSKQILKDLSQKKNIQYVGKRITGDLDFTLIDNKYLESSDIVRTRIESSVTFVACVFEGQVIASRRDDKLQYFTQFEQNISFLDVVFNEGIQFKEVSVDGFCSFNKCRFAKTADFRGASFGADNVFFMETAFEQDALFQSADFHGRSNFMLAKFDSTLSFQNALFTGSAQFGSIQANGYADFSGIKANQGFKLNYGVFSSNFVLNNAAVYGTFELMDGSFSNAEIDRTLFFGEAKFNNTSFSERLKLTNTTFFVGAPDTEGIKIVVDSLLMLENTYQLSTIPVEITF